MKRFLSLLALFFLLAALPFPVQAQEMPDFTVRTLDGTFSLSGTLAEKKMVLINLFATWCPPCKMEFPFMQEAYEQYKDSVAVIALSVEPGDTDAALRSYAEELGLTFEIGSDTETALGSMFSVSSIPTTIVVDRFGQIAMKEAGARSSTEDFLNLFDYFTSEYYTESTYLNNFPVGRADSEGEDEETLRSALGDDARLSFLNPENPYLWPMKSVSEQDRHFLQSAAPSQAGSRSSLSVLVSSENGDALAFDLRTFSMDGVNLMQVQLDGEEVFVLGGDTEWTRYAVALSEGEHRLDFTFIQHMPSSSGEYAAVDSFALLSGEDAQEALLANPVYPASVDYALTLDGASLISFSDPAQVLPRLFGPSDYCLFSDTSAEITVSLPEDADPHRIILYAPGDQTLTTPAAILHDGSYRMTVTVPEDTDSASVITNIYLYASIEDALSGNPLKGLTVFPGEKSLQSILSQLENYGYSVTRNP